MIKTLTPPGFARDECANMLPDGACLGISADSLVDHGQEKTCDYKNSCLVAKRKRCPYFERVILPLADQPGPQNDPGLQARRAEARDEYWGWHARAINPAKRKKPTLCGACGKPKPPRHRFCSTCASKRRRESARTRVNRHRSKEPVTL